MVAIEDQVSCDLEGEAVILSLRNGEYYGLDEVGARIWSLIQQPRTVASIRNTILAEFEVEKEQCEPDLLSFLEDLRQHRLVEIVADEEK
jgi:hypothetical protein